MPQQHRRSADPTFTASRHLKLLKQTDESIEAIADAVGYTNQSKFTVAFRDVMECLSKDYRCKK